MIDITKTSVKLIISIEPHLQAHLNTVRNFLCVNLFNYINHSVSVSIIYNVQYCYNNVWSIKYLYHERFDTGFIVQICNQSMLSSSLVLIDEKNAFVIYDAAKKVYFNNTNCNVCSIKLTTHLNYSIMNIALLQPTAICYNTHIL